MNSLKDGGKDGGKKEKGKDGKGEEKDKKDEKAQVAQQNYIVPVQQPQQPTNTTDASSKPVSSITIPLNQIVLSAQQPIAAATSEDTEEG